MRFLLILFIVVPIVEMTLLIEVGARIGAMATIGLVLLTAVLGLNLLRQQGFSTLMRVNEKLESGELPAQEIAEGLLLAIGGALLLTPGFFTDAIGFACLLPWSRRWLVKRGLLDKGFGQTQSTFNSNSSSSFGSFQPFSSTTFGQQRDPKEDASVLEGEFHEEPIDPHKSLNKEEP